MNVARKALIYSSIADYVDAAINVLFDYGAINAYPVVSYADDYKTTFLTFDNSTTNGQSFMKVIEGKQFYYIANANYNLWITNPGIQDELIGMVANFTLIE